MKNVHVFQKQNNALLAYNSGQGTYEKKILGLIKFLGIFPKLIPRTIYPYPYS
jgi:hypothetical protein